MIMFYRLRVVKGSFIKRTKYVAGLFAKIDKLISMFSS